MSPPGTPSDTYVAGDGDGIGRLIGRARLADDLQGIRSLSSKIEAGNSVFNGWCLQSGGTWVEGGGDEFLCVVPPEALSTLQAAREQYEKLVGATISIGLGHRASEASKALLSAKNRGKDRVVLYDHTVELEVRAMRTEIPEQQKLVEQNFQKAEFVGKYRLAKSEPLAKMAMIHNDPKKPMTVYRVQDENGEGPYGDPFENGGLPQTKFPMQNERPNKDFYQPLPENDFDEPDLEEFHGQGENGNGAGYYQFAFKHPHHAERWFGRDGIEELYQHGYRVKAIPAQKVYQSASGHQVFFEPHPSYNLDKVPDAADFDHPTPPPKKGRKPRMAKAESDAFWHGSPSGELKGSPNGLHVGTREAAEQALHARIGVPVEGSWDGTRQYGKTMLAGKKTLTARGIYPTGHNCGAPDEDYLPTKMPSFGDGSEVMPTHRPDIFPVQIVGPMSNTPQSPHEDFKANGYMRAAVTKGNAKRGYYYRNIGEDSGSISAVIPNGGGHLKRLSREAMKKNEPLSKDLGSAGSAPQGNVVAPAEGTPDHSAGGQSLLDAGYADESASGSPEQQFRQLAEASDRADRAKNIQNSGRLNQVKVGVSKALTAIQGQLPVLQQLKDAAPDAYAAVVALTQAVVSLGREVAGADQDVRKAMLGDVTWHDGLGSFIPGLGHPLRKAYDTAHAAALASRYGNGGGLPLVKVAVDGLDFSSPELDPDRVDFYRAMIQGGDELPPLVVSGGSLVDGAHRLAAAAMEGVKELPAYEASLVKAEGFLDEPVSLDPGMSEFLVGIAPLAKRSKNVRQQVRDISYTKAAARRLAYIKTTGLAPEKTFDSSTNFPAARGNRVSYGNNFGAEHEAAHAMMTPQGSTIRQYQNRLNENARYRPADPDDDFGEDNADAHLEGTRDENVANAMENMIDRRAGVSPHAGTHFKMGGGPKPVNGVAPFKVRPGVRQLVDPDQPLETPEEWTSDSPTAHKSPLNGVPSESIREDAASSIGQFDRGAKFNRLGMIDKNPSLDARINNGVSGVAALRTRAKARGMLKQEAIPNEDLPDDKTLDKGDGFPTGTVKDGRVKVEHWDGSTGWRGARAGRILGRDPAHHAVSSREPGSR